MGKQEKWEKYQKYHRKQAEMAAEAHISIEYRTKEFMMNLIEIENC